MSIAAPMLVISLIIYAGLFGLFIYLDLNYSSFEEIY